MPVSSTTRRSCISPQRPRTAGAFSALTRLPVASRSFSCVADSPTSCWRSSPYAVPRRRSISRICASNFSSVARTGATMPSSACCCACWRASTSIVVSVRTAPRRSLARVRKSSWLVRSASAASVWNVSPRCVLAASSSAR